MDLYGTLRLAGAVALVICSGVATVMFGALLSRVGNPFFWMHLFHLVYAVVMIVSVVAGVFGLLAGSALLTRRPSARSLSIVASFFPCQKCRLAQRSEFTRSSFSYNSGFLRRRGSTLGAVGKAEEQRLFSDRLSQFVERRHLRLRERCKVSRELNVFLELHNLSQPIITVLTGCESVKYIASRIFITPVRVAMAEPSHKCCCCSRGGGVQVVSSLPRAGTFMPMMPICFSTASGSN